MAGGVGVSTSDGGKLEALTEKEEEEGHGSGFHHLKRCIITPNSCQSHKTMLQLAPNIAFCLSIIVFSGARLHRS